MNRRSVRMALIGVFLIGVYSFVSEIDYQSERMDEAHYCRMVAEGYWPPYRPRHETICKETNHEIE